MKVTEKTIELLSERKIGTAPNGSMRIRVGDNIAVLPDTKLEPYCGWFVGGNIPQMGSYTYSHSGLLANTKVGRYSSIAREVRFFGDQHPYMRFTSSAVTYDIRTCIFKDPPLENPEYSFQAKGKPPAPGVTIGNDVWIGSHVALKPGIHIKDGAVIATGAIVTKDVEPYSVAGGYRLRRLK